jgi:hypothetical protein
MKKNLILTFILSISIFVGYGHEAKLYDNSNSNIVDNDLLSVTIDNVVVTGGGEFIKKELTQEAAKELAKNEIAWSLIPTEEFVIKASRIKSFTAANIAAKTSTSLGAGRTGVKQWLQNAGNLERGQLIKDIEGAGFKKVFDGKGMMHFERGGMKIRLDPPQPGTPFNHMHLNYGGNKSAYDIFLNPVNYKSPAAHIPIR